MDVVIREINGSNDKDFGRCDNSFLVTSKLVLQAQNGKIRYTVVEVPPFRKEYGRHRTDFMEFAGDPDKTIFLAYVDQEIAGQVRVTKSWNDFALIDDFAVDVKFRRRGVGRALIQRSIAWARERGFPGLTLETQDINVPACRLYASCGFELHGFDTHLYKALGLPDEMALFWYLIF